MNHSPLDDLWGATLDHVDLDVTHQVLVLSIRVSSSEREVLHTLECRGLSELRFFNSIPSPWSYAEVTEIRANATATGAMRVEIVLWSEEAGLSIIADSVILDGQAIGG